ncbi:hypothetical protein EJP617_23580 [Erwinia sp. Ejp617]|nr:hypothetical protein EJP617_23580 [Erwinia sp. Ejp617]
MTFRAKDGGREPPDYASGTNDKGVPGQHDAADTAERHQQEDEYDTDFLPVHIVACFASKESAV